ncbi:MAG: alpha/beta fold hydrolase [Blastocatellia bacterium]
MTRRKLDLHRLRVAGLALGGMLLAAVLAHSVPGQDAGMVLRMSVAYRTLKNSRPLKPEVRPLIEQLENRSREAAAERRFGEAVKHLAHGMALMEGQTWTPARALGAALTVRASRVIVEPGDIVELSVSLLFPPDDPIPAPLPGLLAIGEERGGPYRTVEEISQRRDGPDFFSKNQALRATIPTLPDGVYLLVLNYYPEGETSIFKPIPIRVAKGLRQRAEVAKSRLQAVEAKLSPAGRSILPTIEYAVSMIEQLDAGGLSVERADPAGAIARAEEMLAELTANRDPLAKRSGDLHLAYRSEVDQSLQPYRLYIPTTYPRSTDRQWPLVVALHGMGSDENTFFDGYQKGEIKRVAEARGFFVVSPKGRGPTSMYLGSAERDVLDVIEEVERRYAIDGRRIYLMGHSMGGYGTWSIAANHPQRFAALAPIAGGGSLFVSGKLRGLIGVPWYVVHGVDDATVSVEESRKMVEAGRKLGIEIQFEEVVGGDHFNVVVPALPRIFDWFAKQARPQPAGPTSAKSSTSP